MRTSYKGPAASKTGQLRISLFVFAIVGAMISALIPAAVAADPAAIQRELDQTAAAYGRLETELANTEARRIKLESDLKEADRTIAAKTALMSKRAGYAYKHGGNGDFLKQLLLAPDVGVFFKRLFYLQALGAKDTQLMEGLTVIQDRADEIREDLAAAKSRQSEIGAGLRSKREELQNKLRGAKGAAKVGKFGKFESFTLPLSPSGFANTWGARRSGGRKHQGTDVMASCGAPVSAVTSGTIQNLHSGGNGGTMLYLRAGNGDVFFYAHLRRYAPGITTGTSVKTGQLVGYNGNSGNARGGPCHVHFEWHPRGGRPVNPYPLLAAAR